MHIHLTQHNQRQTIVYADFITLKIHCNVIVNNQHDSIVQCQPQPNA